MIAVVVNDSVFAAIIGVSFTAVLGLMAWIVKTLAELDVKVESQEQRLARLEKGSVRVGLIIGSLMVIGVMFVSSVAYDAHLRSQRRHDLCVQLHNAYDGQFTLIRFIAKELHASKAQTDAAIADLRHDLGEGPTC